MMSSKIDVPREISKTPASSDVSACFSLSILAILFRNLTHRAKCFGMQPG